jgi:hypothetical protein
MNAKVAQCYDSLWKALCIPLPEMLFVQACGDTEILFYAAEEKDIFIFERMALHIY